ncbi:hypothetical protein AAY473_016807 [Plecturocebus cupreus]
MDIIPNESNEFTAHWSLQKLEFPELEPKGPFLGRGGAKQECDPRTCKSSADPCCSSDMLGKCPSHRRKCRAWTDIEGKPPLTLVRREPPQTDLISLSRLECSGMMIDHCSLKHLGLSNSPMSAHRCMAPRLTNFLNFCTDRVSLCCPACSQIPVLKQYTCLSLPKCWNYRCEAPCPAEFPGQHGKTPSLSKMQKLSKCGGSHLKFQLLGRLRQEDHLNPGSGGYSQWQGFMEFYSGPSPVTGGKTEKKGRKMSPLGPQGASTLTDYYYYYYY